MDHSFGDHLACCRAGDRAALETLFARWRPLLWLQARRLIGPDVAARVDAGDVVQETLTQAFQDLAQFRGQTEGEWVAWLRRLTAGQASKLRRQHLAGKRAAGRDEPYDETALHDGAPDPLVANIQRERAARLADAIAGLPTAMREVVVRRVFDQQPFEVVAQALDRSPGATRVLWTRALRQLRDALPADASTTQTLAPH